MLETVKFSFYGIEKIGYYLYGSQSPEFGLTRDLLNHLKEWVSPGRRALENTCTYHVGEECNLKRTFCYNITNNETTGDYCIATWNETFSSDGAIPSVAGAEPVGRAAVSFTNIPAGSIPGHASYFWIIPSENVLATIKFQNQLNGLNNFKLYFREFIAKFTPHVVLGEGETSGRTILGYRNNASDSIRNLNPQFKLSQLRTPGLIERIIQNHDTIIKIIRKNSLNPNIPDNVSLWQSLLSRVYPPDSTPTLEQSVKIKYEVPFSGSKDELIAIVDNWIENNVSKFDDVGFVQKGSAEVFWLSQATVKDELTFDVRRHNSELVDLESLMNSLAHSREHLLRNVKLSRQSL